ncbi:Polyadenylate-binding protein RBP47B', partial [Camellia lanceoleosa]
ELPGVWSQQANPSQWSSTYYGYGQGYDAYGYGTTHDPSLYAYGAYPGYAQYPQQPTTGPVLLIGTVQCVEFVEYYMLAKNHCFFWACSGRPTQLRAKHVTISSNLSKLGYRHFARNT